MHFVRSVLLNELKLVALPVMVSLSSFIRQAFPKNHYLGFGSFMRRIYLIFLMGSDQGMKQIDITIDTRFPGMKTYSIYKELLLSNINIMKHFRNEARDCYSQATGVGAEAGGIVGAGKSDWNWNRR